MNAETGNIIYLSGVISQQGIYEKAGVLAPLFILRSEIKKIELMKGVGAERPLIGLLIGFGILVAAQN